MVQRGRIQLSLRLRGFGSHGNRVGFFLLICLAEWVLVAVLGIFGCGDGLSGCVARIQSVWAQQLLWETLVALRPMGS